MTTHHNLPPLPEPNDLDSDSGEGGRGGAIWHTTDDLIAYAAPLAAEIARLQAQLDSEQEHLRDTMQRNVALQAQVVELADALRELVTVVRGECPSLLNEDSGGSPELSFGVDDALAKAGR